MFLFTGRPGNFCPICQEENHHEQYQTLQCGHQMHFGCVYDMVTAGRIYKCPVCRHDFSEHWVENFSVFIYNEADNRNERQLWLTRLGQMRNMWRDQHLVLQQNAQDHQPMNTPPPLNPIDEFIVERVEHPPIEEFEIDQDGNWILQLGNDKTSTTAVEMA